MKHFALRKNSLRSLLFICLTGISISTAHAQSWNFAGPTTGTGSIGAEAGRGICTDASGNLYTIGIFANTCDFDILGGTSNATAAGNDGYIASYDKDGVFRWKVIIGSTVNDFGQPSGAIATNGTDVWFTGTVNMGGGSATVVNAALTQTVTVTGGSGNDAIVGKISCSNGNIQWAKTYGASGTDGGQGICVDPNGCCYTLGQYTTGYTIGSVTFPTPTGGSFTDMYIAKFSPSGTLIHVATGGASVAGDMGFDGGSLCYVPGATPAIVAVGSFGAGTATFGSFTGIASSGGNDAFLLRLDTLLNFTGALGMGTAGQDELLGAVYDPFSGGVYVCGGFAGASFPTPGSSPATLSTAGLADIVVARYDVANNNFIWSRSAGGTNPDQANAIAVDGQGGILVTGFVSSAPANFGSLSMSSGGADDIFVVRYNPLGTPVWLVPGGGTGGDDGRGIASYVQSTPYSQSVYVTGNFQTSASFGSTTLTSTGGNEFFVARVNDLSIPLSATQSQVNLTCNGVCTGSATVVASGGTAPYTYSWSPAGGSGATASSLCATNYTVTITDAASASITKTFNITQPPAIVITPISQTNVSCFGGSNGAAQVTATGGTGTLTYNWTPLNPTGDGTGSVTGLTAQVYTVTVTDANSCTATRTFNITQPGTPVSGTTVRTNVSCFGGSNGAINLTPSGGTPGYTFNWLPSGPTTEDRTGLTAGTYSVQITDANGCTGTVTATVTQPTSPVSGTTVVTNVACFGGNTGAINLTPTGGTGPYTFNWLPSGPTTEDRTGLVAGTYSVQITDVNGCTGTVTATVTQPTSPVSGTTVVTNVSCFGGSNGAINLTPTGGTGPYTFNWLPSGPTTEDRTGLTAGTYSVQITDANGCTGTVTATVTQPTSPVSGTTVVTNVACFGGNTGAINLTPTGGTGPYTFNWLPSGPTTEDRTGLIAGTYSVQITDVNGCTGTVTATVTQPTSPVSGTTVVTNVACFGGNTGAINLTPTGGTGPYTFNWLPSGPTTEDRTGLTAGTYSVQITDVNGCTGTVTATVTQPTSPVSGTTVVTNVSCFGGSNGAINLTPTGGTGPYTFNWLPSGPTTEDRTGLVAGTYSVQITDANGCTGTVTATVTQPTSPVSGTTVVTNVSCFGGSNGAINLTPTGGTGPYTFNWLPSGPTTEDRTGLVAGTYSVQITDVNGCTGTVTATVTQPTSPVSGTTVVTNVSCFGGSNGAINLTPSGGSGGYTFNWLPSGPTTEDRTGLVAGTYSVQITDVNGCTSTVTATVTQPTSPVSGTTVVTSVSCFGGANGTINLTPSGGSGSYTFNWLPSGPTTEDRTGLVAGTYSVQITDVNGCTGTVTATVTQPTSPVSGTTVVTNVSCFGGSNGAINLTPSGGTGPYTFNWLPSGPTTEDRTGLTAGTYSVQITDVNGCTGTVTATVTQPPAISVTAASQTNIACFGGNTGAAAINAATGGAGSFTYDWTPGNPTGDGTTSVTGLTAGTWTVTTTDANGCTATQAFNVTQPPAISVTAASQTNVSCFGGSNGAAAINAATGGAGSFTYDWTPGNPTGDGTTSVTGLTAGTWTVTTTDANGCTATNVFTVTQPPVLAATPASQTNVLCFGGNNGAASVTATGGTGTLAYNWTPGNPTGDGTNAVTGLTAGTWTVTVTDANSCTSTASFLITEPPVLAFTSTQTDVSCNGGSNGSATVVATGGTGTYTYQWSPSGGNTDIATGLAAGSYTVVITDANTCTATGTVLIAEPTEITYSSMQTDVSCNGGSNGDAMVMASGGTGSLSYLWSSGGTTAMETGLSAGNYSVVITDANSCTVTASFTITEPTPITYTSMQTNVSCNAGNNGDAMVMASGGTGTLTYLWSSGGTAAMETGLSAGNYSVVITDANSCSTTATFTITEPTAITYTSMQTNVSCNGGSNGDAMVMASGGTGTLTYLWSSGGTAAMETGLSAGNYSVVITDANSCSTTATFTITEPTAITFTSSQTDVSCNGGNDGTAAVVASGGTGSFTYAWTSGGNTANETGLSAGNYSVVITDANSCSTTASFTITEPSALTFTSSQTDVSCNGGNNGSAMVVVSGGTGAYTYSWTSGGTSDTETGLSAGNYAVTITDANSCFTTAIFTITEPSAIVATVDATVNPSTCGATDGSIDISVSGGTAGYTFLWSNSDVNEDLAGIGAGSYTVTITDANGCTATAMASINDPGAPTVTLALPMDTVCDNTTGTITLSGESPAGGTFSGTAVVGNTFDPSAAGVGIHYITYTFTDINGCTGTTTDSIFVDGCMGVESNVAAQQWNVFPNPTNAELTINTSAEINTDVLVEIYSADGKLIASENKQQAKTITLDMSAKPVGVYFIRITANEKVSMHRVVKI